MAIDKEQRLKEAYYECGEVRCGACDEAVDLSDAEDFSKAVEVWNEHVKAEHSDKED